MGSITKGRTKKKCWWDFCLFLRWRYFWPGRLFSSRFDPYEPALLDLQTLDPTRTIDIDPIEGRPSCTGFFVYTLNTSNQYSILWQELSEAISISLIDSHLGSRILGVANRVHLESINDIKRTLKERGESLPNNLASIPAGAWNDGRRQRKEPIAVRTIQLVYC